MQEQFYLLWPHLLLVPGRWLAPVLLGICAFAPGFRAACLALDVPMMIRWLALPGSLDAFAMGGLLALNSRKVNLRGMWVWAGSLLALACYLVSKSLRHLDGTGNPWMAFVETFEVLAFGWIVLVLVRRPQVVLVLVRRPQGLLARALSSRPLAFLGTLSYGLFVWHMLVASALGPWLDVWGLTVKAALPARTLVLLTASFFLAWLSWVAIEKPSIGWARRTADWLAESLAAAWKALAQRLALLARASLGEKA